jgi:hypothetical protein
MRLRTDFHDTDASVRPPELAASSVVVGFLLALLTQIAIFPMFGLTVSVGDNLLIGSIFTAVSVVRSYTMRRLFEAMRVR